MLTRDSGVGGFVNPVEYDDVLVRSHILRFLGFTTLVHRM
jgi:Flp pilus assembly protein CpaB